MTGPGPIGRRSLLRAAGLGGVTAATSVGAVGLTAAAARPAPAAAPDAPGSAKPAPAPSFHGPHQAGVLRGASPSTMMLALDVTATSKAELADLFRTLTARAAFLTSGGLPDQSGVSARRATPARWAPRSPRTT